MDEFHWLMRIFIGRSLIFCIMIMYRTPAKMLKAYARALNRILIPKIIFSQFFYYLMNPITDVKNVFICARIWYIIICWIKRGTFTIANQPLFFFFKVFSLPWIFHKTGTFDIDYQIEFFDIGMDTLIYCNN